jgi:hypothetical protein
MICIAILLLAGAAPNVAATGLPTAPKLPTVYPFEETCKLGIEYGNCLTFCNDDLCVYTAYYHESNGVERVHAKGWDLDGTAFHLRIDEVPDDEPIIDATETTTATVSCDSPTGDACSVKMVAANMCGGSNYFVWARPPSYPDYVWKTGIEWVCGSAREA